MKVSSHKAFTLIELLIVVAIIGILVTVGLGSYRSSQVKARDVKRKADASNISKALTMYYNDHGRFPEANNGEIMGTAWGDEFSSLEGVIYMKKLPSDPFDNVKYIYETDDDGSYYRLYTILENSNDAAYEVYQCTESEECNYCIASSNKLCALATPSPTSAPVPTTSPLPTSTPVPLPTTTPTPATLKTNGEICSSDGECDSDICGTDADSDNYFSEALGHTGTCQATSHPYTDCCDSDGGSHPGADYHTSTNACGSWDWDCNGGISKSNCSGYTTCSVGNALPYCCSVGCTSPCSSGWGQNATRGGYATVSCGSRWIDHSTVSRSCYWWIDPGPCNSARGRKCMSFSRTCKCK